MNQSLSAGLLLFVFTVVSIFLVSETRVLTVAKIAENERAVLVKRLNEIVSVYDNDPIAEHFEKSVYLHNIEQTIHIYPVARSGRIFAHLVEHRYPNGYNGEIKLLSGITTAGKILGVRAIDHKETPGLGDRVDVRKSNWILGFAGLSLQNPPPEKWRVRRDGGGFDQFTGATITPRAVVAATYELLEYLKNFDYLKNSQNFKHSANFKNPQNFKHSQNFNNSANFKNSEDFQNSANAKK